MTFPQTIRARRLELGLSPITLARESGIASYYIEKIEAGACAALSNVLIWKLGHALGFDDETIQQYQQQYNG